MRTVQVRHMATPAPSTAHSLDVAGLAVEAKASGRIAQILQDVSLTIASGQVLGLVGESGSGKTITSLAIMGVLPRNARIAAGSISLDGNDLTRMARRDLEKVRGRTLSMIFQDAIRSLNPAFTVGDQIAEVARHHMGLGRRAARARAIDMLAEVGIREPRRRVDDYPHQFSGGMAQRVMIAMALVCDPTFLIADEPTTALDVTVQAQVLQLLMRLQEQRGLGVLFITHDLGVVAEISDRVAVMYAGQVVESGDTADMFRSPRHPYTAGLLDSVPQAHVRDKAFGYIPGVVPSPFAWPTGCRFRTRCIHAKQVWELDQSPLSIGSTRSVRCIRSPELELNGVEL